MSAISQDFWAAGWMMGNEYAFGDALHEDSHRYWWSHISYGDVEELRVLSDTVGGWIWTGPHRTYTPQFVTLEAWKSIFESVDENLAEEIGLDGAQTTKSGIRERPFLAQILSRLSSIAVFHAVRS